MIRDAFWNPFRDFVKAVDATAPGAPPAPPATPEAKPAKVWKRGESWFASVGGKLRKLDGATDEASARAKLAEPSK